LLAASRASTLCQFAPAAPSEFDPATLTPRRGPQGGPCPSARISRRSWSSDPGRS
jgi:hypothetical protein